MIGDHQQQGLIVNLLHDPPDQRVHAVVEILNHPRLLVLRHISCRRMIFVEIAPEHVLHAVGGVEDAGAQALRSFFQRVKKHALAVFMIAVALRQKCLVVEHFFVQRPGILRQP